MKQKDIYIQQYINKLEELMYKYKETTQEDQRDLLAVELSKTLFSFINTGYKLPVESNGIVTIGDKVINEIIISKGLKHFINVQKD